MPFKVYHLAIFEKHMQKLSPIEVQHIARFEDKLMINPMLGKPLSFPFLREKKLNGKRAYFLVYLELNCVLMVAISDKKTQQVTIDLILSGLDAYKKYVEQL